MLCAAWTHYAFRRLREFWEASAAALEQARRVGDTETLAQRDVRIPHCRSAPGA